jgi:hypothetical protein
MDEFGGKHDALKIVVSKPHGPATNHIAFDK